MPSAGRASQPCGFAGLIIHRPSKTTTPTSPQALTKALCKKCNIIPYMQKPSGVCSRYCSGCKKANKSSKPQVNDNAPPKATICQSCNRQPCYKNNSYCSQACANAGVEHLKAIWKLERVRVEDNPSPPPGKECIICRVKFARMYGLCGNQCITDAQARAPCILLIPDGHDLYKSVRDQFTQSWRHPTPPTPNIKFIYKIINVKLVSDRYETYKQFVENKGHFVGKGVEPGNERRRWHGTKRECGIGSAGNTKLCDSSGCSLCSIISNSFLLNHAKSQDTSFQRFGKGIYTSSTSSKSHSYASSTFDSCKAVLLNRVVVGNGKKLETKDSTLSEPPVGYDSVIGQTGRELQYDELIVYREDAIIPSYLVIYDAC